MAKRKKRNFKAYTQCDKCAAVFCPQSRMVRCGRLEFEALCEDESYECPEFQEGYWEKLCA